MTFPWIAFWACIAAALILAIVGLYADGSPVPRFGALRRYKTRRALKRELAYTHEVLGNTAREGANWKRHYEEIVVRADARLRTIRELNQQLDSLRAELHAARSSVPRVTSISPAESQQTMRIMAILVERLGGDVTVSDREMFETQGALWVNNDQLGALRIGVRRQQGVSPSGL